MKRRRRRRKRKAFIAEAVFIIAITAITVLAYQKTSVVKYETGMVLEKIDETTTLSIMTRNGERRLSGDLDFFNKVRIGDIIVYETLQRSSVFGKSDEVTTCHVMGE